MKKNINKIRVLSIIFIINLSILYSLPNATADTPTSIKKLLCIHGWNGKADHFEDVYNITHLKLNKYPQDQENDFVQYYGTGNIESIEYYNFWGDDSPVSEGFESVDKSTPIEVIAELLKDYITEHYSASALAVDTVYLDIVAHSMGGLIVRYMVKHFFMEIFNVGIKIEHIVTIASPNQGTFLGDLLLIIFKYPLYFGVALGYLESYFSTQLWGQVMQLSSISSFITNLNYRDQAPYSINDADLPENYEGIKWSTFTSSLKHVPWILALWLLGVWAFIPNRYLVASDGVVDTFSVPLIGNDVYNHEPYYGIDHGGMLHDSTVLEDVYNELTDNRQSKDASFSNLKINQLEDSLGEIEISTDIEILTDYQIDPDSVTMILNGTEYSMQKVAGTQNTYTADVALEDGSYEYYFTARDLVGTHYTSTLYPLNLIDDDILPPEITISPDPIVISDEEAIDGIPINWQITDPSGIASASVSIGDDTIATYGISNQISDSFIYHNNIPGVYPIEITGCDNDNDPNHNPQAGPDQLETTKTQDITIFDDDTTPPTIAIDYEGSNLDSNPGNWEITVNVEDGDGGIGDVAIWINGVQYINDVNLDGISSKSYTIPVPANPNGYTIKVTAKNDDRDREGDQESCTVTDFVEIEDDDTTRPVIESVEYAPTIFDSDDSFDVYVTAYDSQSGIDSVYGVFFQQNDGIFRNNHWEITIQNTHSPYLKEGINHFLVVAWDGDKDRPNDQSVISASCPITVIDDDIVGPEASLTGPLEILYAQDTAVFSITAADPSGISSVDFWVQCGDEIVWRDSILVDSNSPNPITIPYLLPIEKEGVYSLFRKPFTVNAQAWDNDNDRHDDAEAGEVVSFSVEPDDITPPIIKIDFFDFEVHIGEGIEYFFTTTVEDPESGIDPNGITIHINQNLFLTVGTSSILIDNAYTDVMVTADIYNADTTHGPEDRELGSASLQLTADMLREKVMSQFLNDTFAILFGLLLHPEYWMDSGYYYRDLCADRFIQLQAMLQAGDYTDAYNYILYEIKPQVTGYATDENEVPWSGTVAYDGEVWIVYAEGREMIRLRLNALMHELRLLAFGFDENFGSVISEQIQSSIDAIQITPDDVWTDPAYRQLASNGFSQIASQIQAGDYVTVYQSVLEMKFHLTGIATDELDQPWMGESDPRYTEEPWLSDAALVLEVENVCNRILNEVYIMIHGLDAPHSQLLKVYITEEVNEINAGILVSPSELWIPRGGFRYQTAMVDKFSHMQDLIGSRDFIAAYEMLLYDIKPKLTGCMTDEHDQPWGEDIVYDRPWILNPDTRMEMSEGINAFLASLRVAAYGSAPEDVDDLVTQINGGVDTLTATPSECWKHPASNVKNAMMHKFNELQSLILVGEFSEAYDTLLYDIKPKLTGLKTDEEGNPWGNGVFTNPWIVDPELQAEMGAAMDSVLSELWIWAFGPSDAQCDALILGLEGGKTILLMISVANWRVLANDAFDDYSLLQSAIQSHDYAGAYDLMLCEIKPRLTGSATDEFGLPWNDSGVEEHPWIADKDIPEIIGQIEENLNQFLYVLHLN